MKALLLFFVLVASSALEAGVPDPFRENNSAAFEAAYATHISREWALRRARMIDGDGAFLAEARDLVARGELEWNAVGCAFGPKFSSFANLTTYERRLLGSSNVSTQREATNVILDHEVTREENPKKVGKRRVREIVADLVEKGFSKVGAWPFSRTTFRRIVDDSREKLSGNLTENVVSLIDPIPLLETPGTLFYRHLAAIAWGYLGSDAVLSGYALLRLGDALGVPDYVSGLWHHDRCGSRLKVFVFIHDVSERPTEIAVGSQRTFYWSYHNINESRYDGAWVAQNYERAKMVGPAGGGFVFDTNTIHRGALDGPPANRTVLFFEINPKHKARDLKRVYRRALGDPALANKTSSFPCPSRLRRLHWEIATAAGQPHFRRPREE